MVPGVGGGQVQVVTGNWVKWFAGNRRPSVMKPAIKNNRKIAGRGKGFQQGIMEYNNEHNVNFSHFYAIFRFGYE